MTRVIEADETGRLVLTPEMLEEAQPNGRYIVESTGKKIILEQEDELSRRQRVYEAWKRDWDALTEEISAVWDSNKSAAEIVAEMRR